MCRNNINVYDSGTNTRIHHTNIFPYRDSNAGPPSKRHLETGVRTTLPRRSSKWKIPFKKNPIDNLVSTTNT